jgi:DNA repair exonuclease SbcCD ATPase subunit
MWFRKTKRQKAEKMAADLAGMKGRKAELERIFRRTESISGSYINRLADLAQQIAELEEKLRSTLVPDHPELMDQIQAQQETIEELVESLKYMVDNVAQPVCLETREGFARAKELVARGRI